MTHNKLVERLLTQFSRDMEVFFKTPDSPNAIPLSYDIYEVDNTLVFFKGKDGNAGTSIKLLTNRIFDNYYTSGEFRDDNFMIAICNDFDWDDDEQGFANLLCITDAIQIDDKVILTTKPFDENVRNEFSEKLTIISEDQRLLDKFIEEIDSLRNSLEFSDSIHIF